MTKKVSPDSARFAPCEQLAHHPAALLVGVERGVHHDPLLHEHHRARLGDHRLAGIERHDHRLKVVADELVVDLVGKLAHRVYAPRVMKDCCALTDVSRASFRPLAPPAGVPGFTPRLPRCRAAAPSFRSAPLDDPDRRALLVSRSLRDPHRHASPRAIHAAHPPPGRRCRDRRIAGVRRCPQRGDR